MSTSDDERLAEIRTRLIAAGLHGFVATRSRGVDIYRLGVMDVRWLLGQVDALRARVADRDHELIRVRAEVAELAAIIAGQGGQP